MDRASNLIHEPRPFSRVDVARADEATPFGVAMGALILALANADRALRGQPALTSPLDIHPDTLAAKYHAAGLEAVLRQQPDAERAAFTDASAVVVERLEQVVGVTLEAAGHPAARAFVASEAYDQVARTLVRVTLDSYRASLAAHHAMRGQL